jgi:predicted SAM-dependent methyltransferase
MYKIEREVRRIIHKLPVVGKHVDFPGPAGSHGRDLKGVGGGSNAFWEAQVQALSGLRSCTQQQHLAVVNCAADISEVKSTVASQKEWLIRLDEQIGSVLARLEFVRQESLVEIQRLASRNVSGTNSIEDPQCEVVNNDLLRQMRKANEVKINLGCGHKPQSGYLNVDSRKLPGVDVVAAVGSLPFEPEEISEIYSAHLLEHFTPNTLEKQLLPYWMSLLAPGARFRAVVPDASSMIRAYSDGKMSFEDLRLVTYGGQEYQGNFHYTMFNCSTLAEVLEAAGFVDVEVIAEGRRNGLCLELEISARKPS